MRYRSWCKTCQKWEIRSYSTFNCGAEYVQVDLSEIPESQIVEQRERYKKYKVAEMLSIYNMMVATANSGVKSDWSSPEIVEDDAGQAEIDRLAQIERKRINAEMSAKLTEIHNRNMQPNSSCHCGSGNKYKKCCKRPEDEFRAECRKAGIEPPIGRCYVKTQYEPGTKVQKVVMKSGTEPKPFKSGLKVNTIKGIVPHPFLKGEMAYTFEEDDSFVECRRCIKID